MRDSGIIEQYISVCQLIDTIISEKGHGKHALNRICDECEKREGLIWSFVSNRRKEIMGWYEDLWTEEGANELRMREMERLSKEKWMTEGRKIGLSEGRDIGLSEGREIGQHESKMEIARILLRDGFAIDKVRSITGLPIEDLRALQNRPAP